jgi:hypothetical protein
LSVPDGPSEGPRTVHARRTEAINETAGERVISSTYVWQLRTGRRDNPTQKHLSALASFFGVSPMYFFLQAEADRDAVPPELIAALKNDEVRDMVLRTVGLSDRALRAIRDMIENARAVEGLPTQDPLEPEALSRRVISWRGVMHGLDQVG